MTVQLDEVHGVADAGQPDAVYEDASVGDEHVFFTDSQRLTTGSTGQQTPSGARGAADLYEYAFDPATDTGSLVDMTAPVNAGEAAGVVNVVGASEDGSVVYVVATGVLTPETEENGNGEHAIPGQPNLYELERVDGSWKARYIAMLSETDREDWGANNPPVKQGVVAESGKVEFQTTRVSPDGRWLAFMSDRSLTGYDNEDVTSRAPGERMDEEVFLYDANTNRVVCASCDPTGARPHGTATVPVRYSEGSGFLATLRQPRYLSNGGRLFFNSVDALVAGAYQGVTAPYEYEPPANGEIEADGGHDTCTTASSAYVASAEGCVDLLTRGASSEESMFLEASENGNDVFVLTSEKLAPSDIDRAYDVYDAHVCGSGWECPSPPAVSPPCTGTESCRGAPAPQPSIYGAPSSATYSGAGNPAPPPPSSPAGSPSKKTVTKKAAKCKRNFVREKVKMKGKMREVCVKKVKRAKRGGK